MNIAQEIRQIKTLMAQGAQLLLLRLRLLRLDLGAKLTDIIIVLAMLAVIAVALLVGLISLLCGVSAGDCVIGMAYSVDFAAQRAANQPNAGRYAGRFEPPVRNRFT